MEMKQGPRKQIGSEGQNISNAGNPEGRDGLFALGVRVWNALRMHMTPWLLLGLVAAMVLVPLAALLYGALRTDGPGAPGAEWTLKNMHDVYVGAFTGGSWQRATFNSIMLAFPVTILSVSLGVFLSWILARTNIAYKRFFEVAFLIPMFYAGLVGVIGWSILAAPRSGWINIVWANITNSSSNIVDIYSYWGMVWVMTLFYLPYAFIFNINSFRAMDPALEEAATVAGANMPRVFRKVTLPLMLPSTAAVTLFIFTLALEQFTIPGYLGAHIRYDTLAYNIYLRTNAFPADLPGAAAGGTILLLLSGAGLYMYRRMTQMAGKFTTITARGYKPAVIDLGRKRHVLLAFCIATVLVACLIPLGTVLIRAFMRVRTIGIDFSVISLENFRELFNISYFFTGLRNSLWLGFVSAAIIVSLGMLLSVWIVRRKSRPIALTDYLIAMPIAIPGTVFGVGMLWAYIRTPLYMTLSILLLSYVVRYAVYGVRMFSAGLMQTDKALEEAARIAGASPLKSFLRIEFPLMRPIVGSCMMISFLAVMRELSSSVILYGATTTTLPILTWSMLNEGYYGSASCLAVLQVGIVGLVVVIAQYVFGISIVDKIMSKKETDEG